MEFNTVHNKDCIKGIKQLADTSIDIVIVDPPYNIGKDFGNNSDKMNFDEYISWCKLWIKECRRVLKPTGMIFIYGFDEILAHLSVQLPIDKQRWLIWYYTNKNIPSLNFWQRSHESIICHWKSKPIFNRDAVREPYTEGFLKGSAGRVRPAVKSRFAKNGGVETIYNANSNGALPRDVFPISTLAGGASLKERIMYCKTCNNIILPKERIKHDSHNIIIHPTQKPQALTQKLIKSCKPKGEFKVLIPFCGSGSECLETLKNGGDFISFEINKDYIKLSNENLKHYYSKTQPNFFTKNFQKLSA
jgi:site-specific DNA-methyltransferase (adenine-specific)